MDSTLWGVWSDGTSLMGYIVTRADIPDLPFMEVPCERCQSTGGQSIVTYTRAKKRGPLKFIPRSCDACFGTGTVELEPVSMECRSASIVLVADDSGRDGYDGGRLEITIRDIPYLVKLLAEYPNIIRRREGER